MLTFGNIFSGLLISERETKRKKITGNEVLKGCGNLVHFSQVMLQLFPCLFFQLHAKNNIKLLTVAKGTQTNKQIYPHPTQKKPQ